MKVRVLVSITVISLFLALGAKESLAQDTDDERDSTSSRRSSLRDLRDRHQSSSDDFQDINQEFGDIRDRTRLPAERRSVSDRRSRLRTTEEAKPTTSPRPTAPRTPASITGRSPAVRPKAQSMPVGVIAGQKAAPAERGQPKAPVASRPIFYLEPSDMFVTQDEVFTVDLYLSNPSQEMFSELAVALAYDPGKLGIADADPSTTEPELNSARGELIERYSWLASDPSLYTERSDPDRGRLTIRLRTPEGKTDVFDGTLGRFRLVPRASAGEVPLSFVFREGEEEEVQTFVRYGEKDVLGSAGRDDDGVLDATFRMSPVVEMAESPEEQGGDYKTRIRFDPPHSEVSLGEVLDVDIILENPRDVPFDTLNLVLGYDPRVLKVVDYDQNNWTKEGVNIHDGDSVALFPFTERSLNQTLRKQGVILYRAASPQEPIRAAGVVATIRFATVGVTGEDGTAVRVGFHPFKQSFNSGIYYRGKDVLADSEDRRDGFGLFRVIVWRNELTRSRDIWRELEKIQ